MLRNSMRSLFVAVLAVLGATVSILLAPTASAATNNPCPTYRRRASI